MDWVLDNFKLVVAAMVMVVWVIQSLRKKADDVSQTIRPDPRTQTDVDEAERTRRIQEEIRRKILARQRGESMAPPPVPIVDDESRDEGQVPPPLPPVARARHTTVSFPDAEREAMEAQQAAILARQRALAEQMQFLRATREAASAGVPGFPAVSTAIDDYGSALRGEAIRSMLRRDLSDRAGLRRAVLLREILGEAPGLKPGPLVLPRK